MTGVRIDLHVHSSASDGTDTPAEVIRRASVAKLDILALTDHDTQAGMAEARVALPVGLTLVPGMELSCTIDLEDQGVVTPGGTAAPRYPGQRSVHLLAYLFDPADPELSEETARIRDDRVYRAKGMVTLLRERGVNVTWEQVNRTAGDAVVGRPHIARAMAEAGAIAQPSDAFTPEWIGDGGRAFIDRYAIPLGRAIALVRGAGGVPVLAHPRSAGYEVPDEVIVGLAAAGLAGLEVYHPDHTESERARLIATATRLGLVMTGGSDDHGTFNNLGLGREVTPPESYERILAMATGDTPVPAVPPEAVPPQAASAQELPPDIVPPQIFPEE
jgi:predicted metal-dependent phosphoesterase TrpH